MLAALNNSLRLAGRAFAIKPRRQLKEMFVFLSMFSLAAALITIFEPIFFFTQGFALWEIALYYAFHYTLYVLLMPLGGKIIVRVGYERALTLSTPLFILYFVTLAGIPDQPQLFWVALVVLTLFKSLYWPAYHASFATFSDKGNRGTEQSWVRMVTDTAGVVGPLAGGLIASWYGFPALFLITAGIIAIAGFSLLRTRERNHISDLAYSDPWRLLANRRYRNVVVGMTAWGENLIYLVFWPVFMFIALGSLTGVGLVASVTALISVFIAFSVGEISDRISYRRSLKIFAPLFAISYVFLLLARTPLQVSLAYGYSRMSSVSVTIPFLARLYKQAHGAGPLRYSLAFEMMLALAKAATAYGLAVVFLMFAPPAAFAITFVVAGLLALLYMAL